VLVTCLVVLFNQGFMPAGPPASELQMAAAKSLHKVGCSCCPLLVTCCFTLLVTCLSHV
jgi:hypothetical protein